jgi:hypothetical protein
MLPEEAESIREILATHCASAGAGTVLSIASGNELMRRVHQPHIQNEIFQPLEDQGFTCLHHELEPAPGIHISGDLQAPKTLNQLKEVGADLTLCMNLLEHVNNRPRLAEAISSLVKSNGFLLVSVPRSFHYHADPIDTYYRPTPTELAALFPTLKLKEARSVSAGTLWRELAIGGGIGTLAFRLARHFARCITYIPQPRKWISHLHSTLWLAHERSVSIVLLKKD